MLIPETSLSSSLPACTAQNCFLLREKCFQDIHNPATHFCISYTHFTLKDFFKMPGKELPFAKWEVWRSRVAAWDVFHHICLFPHRTELQLLVVEELIQLPLAWLRAGADPKPYPQSVAALKYKKSNVKPPNFHNFKGSIKPLLLLSVQLYWKYSPLYEMSPNPSGGCKVAELYLKTWATDSCHWHSPLGPFLTASIGLWSQC